MAADCCWKLQFFHLELGAPPLEDFFERESKGFHFGTGRLAGRRQLSAGVQFGGQLFHAGEGFFQGRGGGVALLEEFEQLGAEADAGVEQRIGAGDIGPSWIRSSASR